MTHGFDGHILVEGGGIASTTSPDSLYITYGVTPSLSLSGTLLPNVRLHWDGTKVEAHSSVDLNGSTPERLARMGQATLDVLAGAGSPFAAVKRLEASQLHRMPLAQKLTARPRCWTNCAFSSGTGIVGAILDCSSYAINMSEKGRYGAPGAWGWFHPAANPLAYGTPYLLDMDASTWGLFTVGAAKPQRVIPWNDKQGLIRAAQDLTHHDCDYQSIVAILKSHREYEQQLRHHRRVASALEAYADFSPARHQVSPLALRYAVKVAVAELSETIQGLECRIVDLSTSHRTSLNRHPRVYAALEILCHGYPTSGPEGLYDLRQDQVPAARIVARCLAARLAATQLGTVVLVSKARQASHIRIFATRSPALFTQHATAITGIEDAHVEAYPPTPRQLESGSVPL